MNMPVDLHITPHIIKNIYGHKFSVLAHQLDLKHFPKLAPMKPIPQSTLLEAGTKWISI